MSDQEQGAMEDRQQGPSQQAIERNKHDPRGAPARSGPVPFPIAGLGASAGGLTALQRLFRHLTRRCGMAYVVVMHLDPNQRSHLVTALAKHTQQEVIHLENGMNLRADCIHVAPAGQRVRLRGITVELVAVERDEVGAVIDDFLSSLAHAAKELAIGIILSGAGSDGARGIREIKAEGGLTVVQDPEEAEYDAMPRSAIATGAVDCILAVQEIPRLLLDYVTHARLIEGCGDDADELQQVLKVLMKGGKHDFRDYKRGTLIRRIYRRMGLLRKSTLSDYIAYLNHHPAELAQLANDLLIGVTAFFRDPEMWENLAAEVLPELVQRGDPNQPIRAWVAGCSSGEEAYTMAILLAEEIERRNSQRRVQIFATDIDDQALQCARRGVYTSSALGNVSAERLKRWFICDGATCTVRKDLRESVIFAHQNLTGDSPFSRLDLVSCRNLMIYLQPTLQDRVLTLFHFVLNNDGYLVLGSSETIGKHKSLFEPVSRRWRIYRRLGPVRWRPFNFPLIRSTVPGSRYLHPPQEVRQTGPRALARELLLEHFVPAAVLIDTAGEVLYFHGPTDSYLGQPSGEPTRNLLDLARRGLRGRLRTVLRHAAGSDETVSEKAYVTRDGKNVAVLITAKRCSTRGENDYGNLTLVCFQDLPAEQVAVSEIAEGAASEDDQPTVRRLEEELRRTRDELQSTIEQLETANEELKVSHEEAMAMNEELQSTNEELETSKEELQSLNEELSTINAQLEDKVTELQSTTDDLDNLLTSTNIATLFLDRACRVRRFTPAMTRLLRLIDSDAGRPITDITSRIKGDNLVEDARQVLADLKTLEREVQADDEWYIRRTQPYRTRNDRIEGVVVTFIEITERKRREQERARLAAIVDVTDDAIVSKDRDGNILTWNKGAENIYGYTSEEAIGQNVSIIIPPEAAREHKRLMREVRSGKPVNWHETVRLHKSGRRLMMAITIVPVNVGDGLPAFFSTIGRDITMAKAREQEIERLNHDLRRRIVELQTLLEVTPVGILFAKDAEGTVITANAVAHQILGTDRGNVSLSSAARDQLPFRLFVNGQELEEQELPMQRAARDGLETPHAELQLVFKDGRRRDILMRASPLRDESDQPCGAVGVMLDITDRKAAEDRLRRSEARLREQAVQLVEADRRKDAFLAVLGHELRNPLAPIRNILDVLHMTGRPDPQTLDKALDIIDRQVQQLIRLVDDLLDVARITRDQIRLQHESVELNEVVARVVEALRPMYADRKQTLNYQPLAYPLPVRLDPVRIGQVLSNLLNNASNYTAEGGHVELKLEVEDGRAVIRIKDNGTGIEPEHLRDIFDPFSRAASAMAHSGKEGMGLGLSLAQRLVSMHGGNIEARSEGRGRGSEFVVRLPITPAEGDEPATAGTPLPAKPLRMLVVEDNHDAGQALATLLRALGHRVDVAPNGGEAVRVAQEVPPQLVFVDIGLPDMDGYQVGWELRRRLPEGVRLVALSGFGEDVSRQGNGDTPFDLYLLKPLTLERVEALLVSQCGESAPEEVD